jgi:SET domain-containing protein
MKPIIIHVNDRVYITQSPIHGWGVFAKVDMKRDTVLDVCVYFDVDTHIQNLSKAMKSYIFAWPRPTAPLQPYRCVLPSGTGWVYNHSDDANADWRTDEEHDLFVFYLIKDVKAGDEICTNYGSGYNWSNSY